MNLFKIRIGDFGEKAAVDYLLKKGYKIIDRNFRSRLGEIDIVATKNNKIHFIEVKTRVGLFKGYPHEAVNANKIRRIEKLLQLYLQNKKLHNKQLSLDVISIVLTKEMQIETILFYENITSYI